MLTSVLLELDLRSLRSSIEKGTQLEGIGKHGIE
jgi:hypothetical protein